MLRAFQQTDQYLVRRTLSGDRDAYGRLVERHLAAVHAVAFAAVRNHADAEDIAQDAFLKAFEALPTLREPKRFRSWVATIARNLGREHWRSTLRRGSIEPADSESHDLRDVITTRDLHALLRTRLDQLDDAAREVLVLYYFAGRNTREIGQLLEISTAAAKKRLERARQTLSERLLAELDGALVNERPEPVRAARVVFAVGGASPLWLQNGEAAAVLSASAGLGLAAKLGLTAVALGAIGGGAITMQSAPLTIAATPAIPITSPQASAPPMPEAETEQAIDAAAPVAADPSTHERQSRSVSASDEAAPSALASNADRALNVDLVALRDMTENALDTRVTLNFEQVSIATVCNYISEHYGINFIVLPTPDDVPGPAVSNWPSQDGVTSTVNGAPSEASAPTYVTDGIVPYINLRNVPLWEALEALLRPLGLEAGAFPGFIWISTPEILEQRRQEHFESHEAAAAAEGQATNYPELDLLFEDAHIVEILDMISESLDINFVIDYNVIEPPAAEKKHAAKMLTLQIGEILPTPTGAMVRIAVQPEAMTAYREGETVEHVSIVSIDVDAGTVQFRVADATLTRKPGQILTVPRDLPKPERFRPKPNRGVDHVSFLSIRDIPLRSALESMLRPTPYSYTSGPGFILVGPTYAVQRYERGNVLLPPAPPGIATAVETPVRLVETNESTLRKSLSALGDVVGLSITGDSGVQLNIPGPMCHIRSPIPPAAILDGMLGAYAMTWVPTDAGIRIR